MNYKNMKIETFICAAIVAIWGFVSIYSPVSAAAAYLKKYEVPDGDTSFKSYMNYTCITNKESQQWKLQQKAITNEDGLRMIDEYYMVALGSYYVSEIGEKFVVTLDTGSRIKVIIGDIKADEHTDNSNRYREIYNSNGEFISKNVVEFIVDTSTLDKTAKNWGDISAIDGFEGNVTGIYKIVKTTYEKE